jgi:hypothetical protein
MVKEEIRNLGGSQAASMDGQFERLSKKLEADQKESLKPFRQDFDKEIRESFAYTLGQVADLRLFLRDAEGAVQAGLEQFNQSAQGALNYWAHALDKLIAALTIGREDQKHIPAELLRETQKVLDALEMKGLHNEDRAIKLKKTLEAYRATLRP